MASFKKYQTKDGVRWSFQISLGKDPATGKYRYTTRRGFKRKQDAEEAASQITLDVSTGEHLVSENPTFEEVYKEWIKRQESIVKASTFDSKKSKFTKHILPNFAKLYIKEITTKHCQTFIDKLAEEMSSYRDYGIQLNLVFRFAKKHNIIKINPMERIEYPREDDEFEKEDTIQFWEKEIMNKFLRKCEEELTFRNYAMFRLFLYSGLRKGELKALLEEDVLIDSKEIVVNKTLFRREGKYILLKPKTKNSVRKIKLDTETFNILLRLIKLNKELRMEHGNPQGIDHFLFPRSDLQPQRLAHANDALHSACKRFSLPNIKVHGLRHTHASMLFAAPGVKMKDVQMRLGHARISTTMDVYTHVTKQSADSLNEYLVEYLNSDQNSDPAYETAN